MATHEWKFRDLNKGDAFDWIQDGSFNNTFYKRCTKTGPRHYQDDDGLDYRVGSINAKVYHVERATRAVEG